MLTKTYAQALQEATNQCMLEDNSVLLIGEGALDKSGVFGYTKGLASLHPTRVFDSPLSESCITGAVVGAAISNMRPIMVHQRADFSLLAVDPISSAAKWYSTFGQSCPIVLTMVVGRGWGQGSTHSQSPQALFANLPGLKIVMPSNAYDAKGMMIAAIRDSNPVIVLCHRWLFDMSEEVPSEMYEVPLDKAKIAKQGSDITIVAVSYATIEALDASRILELNGVSAEVIDLRSCSPIDYNTIEESLDKTEHLVFVDTGHRQGSIGHEIVSNLSERQDFRSRVLGTKDYPQPTSHFLTKDYYPTVKEIVNTCLTMLGRQEIDFVVSGEHDKPNANYSVTF